jgi:hypothetical protein
MGELENEKTGRPGFVTLRHACVRGQTQWNRGLNKAGMVAAELLWLRDHALDQSLKIPAAQICFCFPEARPKFFNERA